MNNLALVIPLPWYYPGNHGQGHAYGKQRKNDFEGLFNLQWVPGTFQGDRFSDPNYYGHWRYTGLLSANNNPPLKVDSTHLTPDFFQIIDYAMNQAIGIPPNAPNHMRNTFNIGAALIDQYDSDDLHDSPPDGSPSGNTITIIDYDGNPLNYAYGIEALSFTDPHDPQHGVDRPPFAPPSPPGLPGSLPPNSPPTNYVRLNRRFENVGEFGYAWNPANTAGSMTLNFASAASPDRALLDFFTYNVASDRAGIVNLNTRNAPVLASIIRGAWLHDVGGDDPPPDVSYLVSRDDALAAAQAIVQETTSGGGPALSRADVGRLAQVAAAGLHFVPGAPQDEGKQTIARALAEVGQARTWNLMIDVIAQTGSYAPGTPDLSDPTKFIVQGEKRYWLHIALDRDDGTVLGTQLEEVFE